MELPTILIIAGITVVVFGGGIATAVKVLTGRKTSKGGE